MIGAVMETLRKLAARFMGDEQGGEVLEYALIAGIIVVAAIAVIFTVGGKTLAKWTSINCDL
jgi:Flp pilus assembly pilin Flp